MHDVIVTERKEEVELALLKSIDFSGMKAVEMPNGVGDGCKVFKVHWSEGGASVGKAHDGCYIVVPRTMEVGSINLLDRSHNVSPVSSLPELAAAVKALDVKNAIIHKKREYRYEEADGLDPSFYWRTYAHEMMLDELKGDYSKGNIDNAYDTMVKAVEALIAAKRNSLQNDIATKAADTQDWKANSTFSGRGVAIDGSKLVLDDNGDTVTFELQDGKRFSDVFREKALAASLTKHKLEVATPMVVDWLVGAKVDAEATYKAGTVGGTVERAVSLKNRGPIPMVDYCASKSGRPAYLAAKKLFGGCSGAQLFDYEHMSGIKAKILGMPSLKVRIEKSGGDVDLEVPMTLTVAEKGSPCLRATIAGLPSEVAPYIVFRNYLSSGLKVVESMTGRRFLDFCGEIGYDKEQVYGALRKLWQIEAL